ncbi:MAG TPA: hypothetical protein VJ576_07580 [Rhodocyclaceae bacterium]|nr:hypothetical protein [Rhodocyclaceae bacterium]
MIRVLQGHFPLKRLLPIALLGSSLSAPAQTADFKTLCERQLPPPSLQVKRAEGGYNIDRQLSFRELTGMGADLLRHGKQNVLGITRAEMTATVEIKMARLASEQDDQECLSPQVVITVEYKPIKVLVGREFPLESCSYREILQHEMRHVRAYQRHLPLVEAAIRARLSRRANGRLFYGRQGTVEARLKGEVYDKWLPVVDEEIRRVDATQAQIDSAEEYNRMEKVCDGEIQRLIGLDD